GEGAVVLHEHGGGAGTLQRLDDAAADRVVADHGEGAHGDGAAELVGHHRQHAGDLLPARRPRGRVGGVGVHHPAHVVHVLVDVGVRGRVRGGGERIGGAVDDLLPVEGAHHHRLGGQLVVGDAGGLDDEEAGDALRQVRDALGDVPGGPHHQ